MSVVGQAEKKTQQRIVQLFVDDLNYEYLGDRSEAENKNVEEAPGAFSVRLPGV